MPDSGTFQLVDFGVDWLTTTAGTKSTATRLAGIAHSIARQERKAGFRLKAWAGYGYSGCRLGGLEFGERHDGVIVRLSGPVAAQHWRRCYQATGRVSRLDVQLTIRTEKPPTFHIRRAYRQANKFSRHSKRGPTVTLLSSNNESSTLYLGRRISDSFGRIYDKGIESGMDHYKGAVRYEVESKGDFARTIADVLNRSENQPAAIADCVQAFFEKRGVVLPLRYLQLYNYSCPRRRPDAEVQLRWLFESVRGTVKELIAEGYIPEVIEALGITRAHMDQLVQPQKPRLVQRRA